MGRISLAALLFAVLFLLEYLFWLSPLTPGLKRLTQQMGNAFYFVPFHYIARFAALVVLLWAIRPALWPPFGSGWLLSLSLGLAMVALTYILAVRLGVIQSRPFWQEAVAWARTRPGDFAGNILYLLVYPGFGEEVLFRWFFPAALVPAVGAWALLLIPALNMLWHLPVYVDMGGGVSGLRRLAGPVLGPAAFSAVMLTAAGLAAHNLAGVIIAHAFGDWVGSVARRMMARQQPVAAEGAV